MNANLTVKAVARLIQTSPDSVRRWSAQYEDFMSPTATPPANVERKYTPQDVSILQFVAQARDESTPHEDIRTTLATMQSDGWKGLPQAPAAWFDGPADGRIGYDVATAQTQQIAELAASQAQNTMLRTQLETALDRVEILQRELDDVRTRHTVTESRAHGLEVDLERARADVARLEGQLGQYALGRERPVNVGLIMLASAFAAVVLVLVVLVVVRLVL